MQMRLVLLCVCVPFMSLSQEIRYGIKGGVNLSDIVLNKVVNPDLEADYKTKFGPHAGFFIDMQLDDKWSFVPEILYSQKGVKVAETKIHLNYVTFPLLLNYMATDNLRVEAGPEVGYLFLAKSKYGKVNDVYNNNLDIAVNIGGEYIFSEKLFFGIRFNAGFSNLIDDNSASGIKYQNRVVQLSAGYRIGKVAR
jgi:hypothetical protein